MKNISIFTLFLQELQHEVSSLLEFKNALLETFPHLQTRIGSHSALSGSTGELAAATSPRRLSHSGLDGSHLGGSTGQLNHLMGGTASRGSVLLGKSIPWIQMDPVIQQ